MRLKIRGSKAIAPLAIILAACVYVTVAVDLPDAKPCNITIDASRAVSVEWPFQVAIVDTDGFRGLWIDQGAGQGWRGVAGGKATYSFWAPSTGEYRLWVLAYWNDACTNAIFAQVDDMQRVIVGNDPVFREWHWVRGPKASLSKGQHTLVLSNHSNFLGVKEIFLTTDESIGPTGPGRTTFELFYDDFNGCDNGNFVRWKQACGKWRVESAHGDENPNQKTLIGESDGSALLIFDEERWSDVLLNVSIRWDTSGLPDLATGICFGLENENEYCQLRWRSIGSKDKTQMELVRRKGKKTEVLWHGVIPWGRGDWHEIAIDIRERAVRFQVDGREPVEVLTEEPITGGIGLSLEGKAESQFDNVRVRANG